MRLILRILEDSDPVIVLLVVFIFFWSFFRAAMSDDIKEINKKLDTIQEQLNSQNQGS